MFEFITVDSVNRKWQECDNTQTNGCGMWDAVMAEVVLFCTFFSN